MVLGAGCWDERHPSSQHLAASTQHLRRGETMSKIILTNIEPGLNANSEELANVIIQRLGLMPRKKGSTEKMHKVLIDFYERAKLATREKDPKRAIMTVEDMGISAGITRQTMYEYLRRWLELDLISKTSYIDQWNKVIIGYKLNGGTLEQAFERARKKVHSHLDETQKYVVEIQKQLKNEKISEKAVMKANEKKERVEEEKGDRKEEEKIENFEENENVEEKEENGEDNEENGEDKEETEKEQEEDETKNSEIEEEKNIDDEEKNEKEEVEEYKEEDEKENAKIEYEQRDEKEVEDE